MLTPLRLSPSLVSWTPGTSRSTSFRFCTGLRCKSCWVMTLMLAGASLTLCSVAEAVTTSVSSFTSARAGNANDTTDADNPARIKGFNLNIPNLHEVYNQTNKKGAAHTRWRPAALSAVDSRCFLVDVAGRPLSVCTHGRDGGSGFIRNGRK
ncbi:exported hypothetical protein [Klebsiella quasipneumoniae subsp. quasipneumoniae]|nr:exported hypothetical protein [Klebsiella quasipneumoniae subsp. quasipneumoniae]